jgi:hypothetical protein
VFFFCTVKKEKKFRLARFILLLGWLAASTGLSLAIHSHALRFSGWWLSLKGIAFFFDEIKQKMRDGRASGKKMYDGRAEIKQKMQDVKVVGQKNARQSSRS